VGAERERWSCRCETCLARFEAAHGEPMPTERTPEVVAFREASLVDFLGDLVGHVHERGGRSTVCLLPHTEGPLGLGDWNAVGSLHGLDTLATDPYWHNRPEGAEAFVGRFAGILRETASRHGVGAQLWLPSFNLGPEDIPDIERAAEVGRAAGVDELWVWAYEACAHMSSLASREPARVWDAVTRAVTS
jgi:hypothetical protein